MVKRVRARAQRKSKGERERETHTQRVSVSVSCSRVREAIQAKVEGGLTIGGSACGWALVNHEHLIGVAAGLAWADCDAVGPHCYNKGVHSLTAASFGERNEVSVNTSDRFRMGT